MEKHSLTAIARNQLEIAMLASSGRSAQTVCGGSVHVLRQTVIAMRAGSKLEEHENPGEATVQVLTGRVLLTSGENKWEVADGGLFILPPARHAVEALEHSAFLLTVAKLP